MNVEESGGKLKDHKEAKLQLVNVEKNLPVQARPVRSYTNFCEKNSKLIQIP